MENNNKTLNVPNLRFPEFSGEWEYHELQSIAPKISSGKDKPNNEGTVVLYGSTGIMGHTTTESYKSEIVIVARVGANAGQLQLVDIPCGVTDNALVVDAKSWNKYVFYYLQHFNLNKLVFGSGQPLITGGMLKKIKIWAGNNVERNKIVHLLSLMEERVDTQKKVIEDLKRLKYAISKRVFENHGSSNSMFLGKVADIYQPQTIPTSWLNDTLQYPVYGANGVIGKYSEYNHENSQICIACRGNTCGTVNYSEPKSWITGNAMVINTDRYDVNKRFLFHQLCTVNYSPLISGSGQPQIVRAPLEKMKIWFPNKDVQERIATLLDTIEDRILIEETALVLIGKTKQYILSQMFI